MILFKRYVFEIWLFFTMLLVSMTFAEGDGDRTLNLKLGFDIVPRTNGNPSLRIREFGGFRVGNLRKFGKKPDDSQISVRAEDTSVESEDNKENDKDEQVAKESDENDDLAESSAADSEDRTHRSTKGINPEEFEPDRNPIGMHDRGKKSESDTDER